MLTSLYVALLCKIIAKISYFIDYGVNTIQQLPFVNTTKAGFNYIYYKLY